MATEKIVISGMNALCSLGIGVEEIKGNLHTVPAVGSLKSFEFHEFDTGIPCYRIAGLDPVEILGKKGMRTKDFATKLFLSTAEGPFRDVFENASEDERTGLCIGTGFGSVQSIGDFLSDSIVNGVNNVNPQAFANTVINSPTSNANIRYAVKTMSTTISTGFNASLDSLIYASNYIKQGYHDSILAGGFEELSYYQLLGLLRSGVLSKSGTMRPLSPDADGYIMGEGAALFCIETESRAKARGATIFAEIVGTASAFDPRQTKVRKNSGNSGAVYVIKRACEKAGIAPTDIDCIAANANADPRGDAVEASAIAELCPQVPVTAYKRKTGECYGASSALNAACGLIDMQAKKISGIGDEYPVRNDINVVKEDIQDTDTEFLLINAFSCEGNCSSIILKNYS
ncbi:MAG: hypothetical protein GF401_05895 [Chitinivibrionales bacterium]|nr:hypothetical protein [Chitinivibrionales bacterium]